MTRQITLLIIFTLSFFNLTAQEKPMEWYVNASVNCYIPTAGSAKSVFPVLGYNKDTSPKLLIGGVGTSVSVIIPIGKGLHLKPYANLQKLTYWDDPIDIRDGAGAYMGNFQSWSSDYTVGLGTLIHYDLVNRLSLGAGLGLQAMVVSISRMPDTYGYGVPVESSFVVNRYYKRLVPMVPLEISYKLDRMSLNLRYDVGLLNKLKGNLGKSKSEKFGVLALEVGFKISR
ncbi:hypothetical protein [Dyadobacter sp. CY312]|uniref:hypothetical protein n=1 Tax=Dyadobacter sp. CY312 TaxID=2907303 RepID=UPI001F1D0E40|nr:hypothetical protein [Dyadobacter sp. CY312]MCE7044320.1 hypothetical protein [Dyadobacter sp. CY312]